MKWKNNTVAICASGNKNGWGDLFIAEADRLLISYVAIASTRGRGGCQKVEVFVMFRGAVQTIAEAV